MIFPPKEFWEAFKSTYGAFSASEAIALYNICLEAPQGDWMELGTHKGKSTMAVALAMPAVSRLILVEPEFKNINWAQDVLSRISPLAKKNVFGFGSYSLDILPMYSILSFCFVDSGIHDDLVMEESKMLEDKMISGGIIAYHDYLNQFTAVERAYKYLLGTGKYEEIKTDWQPIFDYVKENGLEDGNNSWHIYNDLPHPPNFVGAVRRK